MAINNVLVTLPLDEKQKRRLELIAPNATYVYIPTIDIQAHTNPLLTQDNVEAADVILGDVPPQMLCNCKNLQFLQLDSAGVKDYINGALPKQAALSNATGAYGLAISETMLAMTLMLKKRLHQYGEQQNSIYGNAPVLLLPLTVRLFFVLVWVILAGSFCENVNPLAHIPLASGEHIKKNQIGLMSFIW